MQPFHVHDDNHIDGVVKFQTFFIQESTTNSTSWCPLYNEEQEIE